MTITPELYASVRRSAFKAQDWEDRVHDAIVKFLTMDEPAEPVKDLTAYLAVMIRRQRTDYHRAVVRRPTVSIDTPVSDSDGDRATFADRLRAKDETAHAEKMAEIFGRLTKGETEIVRLMLDGYTQAEIAERLQVKYATFKTRLRRMREVHRGE